LQGELKDTQNQEKKKLRETGKIIDNTRLPADERKRDRKEGRKKGDPNAQRNGSDSNVAKFLTGVRWKTTKGESV